MYDLINAVQQPDKLNIVKVKGHATEGSLESQGNALADRVAKAAAERQPQPHDTKHLLFQNDFNTPSFQHTSALLQKQASADDLDYWSDSGLTRDPTGLWTNKEGVIGIPRAAAPLLLSYLHGFQ